MAENWTQTWSGIIQQVAECQRAASVLFQEMMEHIPETLLQFRRAFSTEMMILRMFWLECRPDLPFSFEFELRTPRDEDVALGRLRRQIEEAWRPFVGVRFEDIRSVTQEIVGWHIWVTFERQRSL